MLNGQTRDKENGKKKFIRSIRSLVDWLDSGLDSALQCTMVRFFKTITEQHGLAKGAQFSIILVVHIHHFEGFLR